MGDGNFGNDSCAYQQEDEEMWTKVANPWNTPSPESAEETSDNALGPLPDGTRVKSLSSGVWPSASIAFS